MLTYALDPAEIEAGTPAGVTLRVGNPTAGWRSNLTFDVVAEPGLLLHGDIFVRGVTILPGEWFEVKLMATVNRPGTFLIHITNVSFRDGGRPVRVEPAPLSLSARPPRPAGGELRSRDAAGREGPATRSPSLEERYGASYWTRHGPPPGRGRAGEVFVSFSGHDAVWKETLSRHLERPLRDAGFQPPYAYDHPVRGTRPSQDVLEQIVDKIFCARAAVVLLSPWFKHSAFCWELELPLLMWRRARHGLPVFPMRVLPLDSPVARYPHHRDGPDEVDLATIIDERKGHDDFLHSSMHKCLAQLREEGLESEITLRLNGLVRAIVEAVRS